MMASVVQSARASGPDSVKAFGHVDLLLRIAGEVRLQVGQVRGDVAHIPAGQVGRFGPVLGVELPEKGDVLGEIDPVIYKAQLDQAVAKKAQDEAQLANQRLDLARYQQLAGHDVDVVDIEGEWFRARGADGY